MDKSLGNIIKSHAIKSFYSIMYIFPSILLIVVAVMLATFIPKVSPENHVWYWAGIVIALVLVILLLIAKNANMPKYSFISYENGIKVIFRNKKLEPKELYFSDLTETWLFDFEKDNNPDHMAFRTLDDGYFVVTNKYTTHKKMIDYVLKRQQEVLGDVRVNEINDGKRLTFLKFKSGGENVVNAEKAIIPYLTKSEKDTISIDRFSIYDGDTAYSIADISKAEISGSPLNIHVVSLAGKTLLSVPYYAVCNADLFVRVVNGLTQKG